ncbi:MAG: hypothetical protein II483_00525 [Lachnospiraceae bacterium]|nr:hypothetical protein [Lachnospiraceae bacterium]
MSILVAVPCMDMVHTDFAFSLACMHHGEGVSFARTKSSLVYDGRNKLANLAINGGFDSVLWLDSDMVFDHDLLYRLSEDLDAGMDMVCGLYVTRRDKIHPVIFKEIGYALDDETGAATPINERYSDYPKDSVFQVEACGFGGVMMKTSLLSEVKAKYGLPFSPVLGFGEDISFCLRVKELGTKIYCDSRVKLGHIGNKTYTEDDINA